MVEGKRRPAQGKNQGNDTDDDEADDIVNRDDQDQEQKDAFCHGRLGLSMTCGSPPYDNA
jgi:hypothetical protein